MCHGSCWCLVSTGFCLFLVLNIADWLSGWQVAVMKHESSSSKGAKGVLKKVWYWVIIGIAFFIGFSFEEMGAKLDIPLGFMPFSRLVCSCQLLSK